MAGLPANRFQLTMHTGLARQLTGAVVNLTGRWNKTRVNRGHASVLNFLRDTAQHRNAGEDGKECRNDDNCVLYLHNTSPVRVSGQSHSGMVSTARSCSTKKFGPDVSVQLLWQFPGVTCHLKTREQLGVRWLEVHHGAYAS